MTPAVPAPSGAVAAVAYDLTALAGHRVSAPHTRYKQKQQHPCWGSGQQHKCMMAAPLPRNHAAATLCCRDVRHAHKPPPAVRPELRLAEAYPQVGSARSVGCTQKSVAFVCRSARWTGWTLKATIAQILHVQVRMVIPCMIGRECNHASLATTPPCHF